MECRRRWSGSTSFCAGIGGKLPHAGHQRMIGRTLHQQYAILLARGSHTRAPHVYASAWGCGAVAPRVLHHSWTGQSRHCGCFGRQTVAPSSIIAWFQSPGCCAASSSLARSHSGSPSWRCRTDARSPAPRCHRRQPPLVEGDTGNGGAGVAPNARKLHAIPPGLAGNFPCR